MGRTLQARRIVGAGGVSARGLLCKKDVEEYCCNVAIASQYRDFTSETRQRWHTNTR